MSSIITQDKELHIIWHFSYKGEVLHWSRASQLSTTQSPSASAAVNPSWKKEALNLDATAKSIKLLPGSQIKFPTTSATTRSSATLRASQDQGAITASPSFASFNSSVILLDKSTDHQGYILYKTKTFGDLKSNFVIFLTFSFDYSDVWTAECVTADSSVADFGKNKDCKMSGFVWSGHFFLVVPKTDSLAISVQALPITGPSSSRKFSAIPIAPKIAIVGTPQSTPN